MIQFDSAIVADTAREPLRLHDLPAAVTAVAALLPRKQRVKNCPDIVDDQGR